MENINLIVVDGNSEVTSSIKKYFEVHSIINVVKTLADGEEALEYIKSNRDSFDVIIMDLIIPKMDGINLLEKLNNNKITKKIIVLSSYMNEGVTKKATSLGVNYYMLKPFSMESLEERIKDLYVETPFESNKGADLIMRVSDILHNLGIPSHIRGYQYIRDGIILLYNKNSYVNYITKDVYPEIAYKYETTSSRVERAIRHAIEISWDRGDLSLMEDLFGHSVDYERSKPTNSEYINTIADRIKMRHNAYIS